MRYSLDTNHAGHLLDWHRRLTARVQNVSPTQVAFCTPSLGELEFGFLKGSRENANRRRLDELLSVHPGLDYDLPAARKYAALLWQLAQQGTLIPKIDIQIAAVALVHDLIVLTADAHFDRIADLRTENWLV